jgi:hypothetical protein
MEISKQSESYERLRSLSYLFHAKHLSFREKEDRRGPPLHPGEGKRAGAQKK